MLLRGLLCRIAVTRLRRLIAVVIGVPKKKPVNVTPPCRHAKAKLQLRLKARAVEKLEPPPESPPELLSGFEVDIHSLIHEDKGNRAALPIDHPARSLTIASRTPQR